MKPLLGILTLLLIVYLAFHIPAWIINIPSEKFGENVDLSDDSSPSSSAPLSDH